MGAVFFIESLMAEERKGFSLRLLGNELMQPFLWRPSSSPCHCEEVV